MVIVLLGSLWINIIMMIEMKNNLKDKLRELTETHDMVSTYWKYAYLQLKKFEL